MAVDPICGVHVNEAVALPREEYIAQFGGNTFYFCSEECKRLFDEAASHYVEKSA